jgi:hypothetical protein
MPTPSAILKKQVQSIFRVPPKQAEKRLREHAPFGCDDTVEGDSKGAPTADGAAGNRLAVAIASPPNRNLLLSQKKQSSQRQEQYPPGQKTNVVRALPFRMSQPVARAKTSWTFGSWKNRA